MIECVCLCVFRGGVPWITVEALVLLGMSELCESQQGFMNLWVAAEIELGPHYYPNIQAGLGFIVIEKRMAPYKESTARSVKRFDRSNCRVKFWFFCI